MQSPLQERVHELVSLEHNSDPASRAFNYALGLLIVANIVATLLHSVPALRLRFGDALILFNSISIVLFTFEYLARVWSVSTSWRKRLRFMIRPMPIIDLLAILPWYLPPLGIDLRILRSFRLLRVIRLLDLGGYGSAHSILRQTLRACRSELLMALNLAITLVLISSSAIYYAEKAAQPDLFGSIPECMWWAVVTLTTVGYGDLYPVTPIGKIIGAIIATLGIGFFALPTGILGAAFLDSLRATRQSASPTCCPKCGYELESST